MFKICLMKAAEKKRQEKHSCPEKEIFYSGISLPAFYQLLNFLLQAVMPVFHFGRDVLFVAVLRLSRRKITAGKQ